MAVEKLHEELSDKHINVGYAGELADIIKDLSESEDHYWASEYRKRIVSEMDGDHPSDEKKQAYSYAVGKVEEHHEPDAMEVLRTKYSMALPDDRERMKHDMLEMMGML